MRYLRDVDVADAVLGVTINDWWMVDIAEIVTAIASIPAADVVEVVRCGQCKHCAEHYDTDGNAPYWTCKEWDSGTDYDGYCHYGERKDGGQDDV